MPVLVVLGGSERHCLVSLGQASRPYKATGITQALAAMTTACGGGSFNRFVEGPQEIGCFEGFPCHGLDVFLERKSGA